ncbi:MAG: hypothetical protein ABIV25_00725 [Paracoccaceae bacterium]
MLDLNGPLNFSAPIAGPLSERPLINVSGTASSLHATRFHWSLS